MRCGDEAGLVFAGAAETEMATPVASVRMIRLINMSILLYSRGNIFLLTERHYNSGPHFFAPSKANIIHQLPGANKADMNLKRVRVANDQFPIRDCRQIGIRQVQALQWSAVARVSVDGNWHKH